MSADATQGSGLDDQIEAQLHDWPAPPKTDDEWDARAAAIEAKLAGLSTDAADDALLAAPLAAEPGEPSAPAETKAAPPSGRGEVSMSQPPEKPKAPEKRVSLAEMARASQASMRPGPRASQPSVPDSGRRDSVPPRASVPPRSSSPSLAEAAQAAVAGAPPASVKRPIEAGEGDSGMIDLKALKAPSTPNAAPAAAGSTSLFEDEPAKKPAVAAVPAKVPEKASHMGLIAGGAMAAIGIAAAVMIFAKGKPEAAPPAPVAAVAETAAAPVAPVKAAEPVASVAVASPNDLPAASADKPAGGSAAGGLVVPQAAKADPVAKADTPAPTAAPAAVSVAAATPAAPGDLKGAMKGAVGAKDDATEKGTPAAAADSPASGSVPEQPSQGAIQGAIGAHMPAAKACIKGEEAVSKVNLQFGSDGKVKSISVSGSAAGKPSEGCIKAAFAKTGVGPFSRPTFSVGFTVRP